MSALWQVGEVELAFEEGQIQMDDRSRRFWERIRVAPAEWRQAQYSPLPAQPAEPFWVVAVMGTRCLYFNHVERGWGWGYFVVWGTVSTYHWQQGELAQVVAQTLFAIDEGGLG